MMEIILVIGLFIILMVWAYTFPSPKIDNNKEQWFKLRRNIW